MLDLTPEPEVKTEPAPQPANSQPERRTINLTQEELISDFPQSAKLAFNYLQHYHLRQKSTALREPAAMELAGLVGSGKITTRILGRSIEVSVRNTPWIKPAPEKEAEVAAARALRYSVLKEALAGGQATEETHTDVAVLIPGDQKEESVQDTDALQAAIDATPSTNITLNTEELSTQAPKLTKFLYCHLQAKDLERKLEHLQAQAVTEFQGRTLTLTTSLNQTGLHVASTTRKDIVPADNKELADRLKAAATAPNTLLKTLLEQGQATAKRTYYVLAQPIAS